MALITVEPLTAADRAWVKQFVTKHWGGTVMVVHNDVYTIDTLPGYVAYDNSERVGLITYRIEGDRCEIMSLDSIQPGKGIGTALLEAVKTSARSARCTRLRLTTTNDNLNALRFYQKRGFRLIALRPNALEQARLLKPTIPLLGNEDIPLRDELELELLLT